MPKVYLLKKLNPKDSIWKHYPEDDFVRWVGKTRKRLGRTLPEDPSEEQG